MPPFFLVGIVLIVGGLVLFFAWFGVFLLLIKALLPLFIIALGGILAYFGWEDRRDKKGAFMEFSSPAEASRYQAEALAYQEKINDLSGAEAATTDPLSEAPGPGLKAEAEQQASQKEG
jgi:hypothetical protein